MGDAAEWYLDQIEGMEAESSLRRRMGRPPQIQYDQDPVTEKVLARLGPKTPDLPSPDHVLTDRELRAKLAAAFEEGVKALEGELMHVDYHPQSTGVWNPYLSENELHD